MAHNYESQGVHLDQLFDPYISGDQNRAWNLQDNDGNPLLYAPLNIGSRQRDIGFLDPSGNDYSNYWAAKGTAQYALPINGKGYSATAQARTNQTGTVNASVTFFMDSNGYQILTSSTGSGTTVRDSGPWTTGNPGDYDALLEIVSNVTDLGSGANATSNAQNWVRMGGSAYVQGSASASVPAASSSYNKGRVTFRLTIRNAYSGAVVSTTTFSGSAGAAGWY